MLLVHVLKLEIAYFQMRWIATCLSDYHNEINSQYICFESSK